VYIDIKNFYICNVVLRSTDNRLKMCDMNVSNAIFEQRCNTCSLLVSDLYSQHVLLYSKTDFDLFP